jgi:hypothetical protein
MHNGLKCPILFSYIRVRLGFTLDAESLLDFHLLDLGL